MLQRIHGRPGRGCLPIRDAVPPAPFPHTPEYACPARGSWNIVHTGMLLPESHQIYICAAGCLRGVVLTAVEMGAMERFSSLEVRECDLVCADQERFIIEGVTDILRRLPRLPRAVLVFTACIHHFLGSDLPYVYKVLRQRFPQTDFAACMMDPIRQSSGLAPEERERREIYRLLRPRPRHPRRINLIGNNLPLAAGNELQQLCLAGGYELRDWTSCKNYGEFLALAAAECNLYLHPFARAAAQDMQHRLGQDCLYLPQSWDYGEIAAALAQLAARLQMPLPDCGEAVRGCERALEAARAEIGGTPLAIDASFTFRPFGLARLLIGHGFHVARIYADAVTDEDMPDFRWLQQACGELELYAIKNADLRLLCRTSAEKVLALGQKAAYFQQTPYFVNLVENGGLYGFSGIRRLAALMREAFRAPKNLRSLIQKKGLGGPCCL